MPATQPRSELTPSNTSFLFSLTYCSLPSDDARDRLGLLLAGLRFELDLLARWELGASQDADNMYDDEFSDEFDESPPSPRRCTRGAEQLSASRFARALLEAQGQSDGHCAALLERDATYHRFSRLLTADN